MSIMAAIQMCSSHLVDDNLKIAQQLIHEAALQGAKLIVLPENVAIMGMVEEDKLQVKEEFGTGKIQNFFSEQAKKNHVWIVAGTIPISCDDEKKVRAASLVFNDEGSCVARYDKIHLFDVKVSEAEIYTESNFVQPGNQIVTVQTPIGKLGLSVCYDLRFPELFRSLLHAGAEIFVLPSAFTVKTGTAHWEVLARSRAIENGCYLIGAGQGGIHSNHRATYGHSLIVDPWGTVVVQKLDATSGIIYSSIDLPQLYAIRESLPMVKHQRIFDS